MTQTQAIEIGLVLYPGTQQAAVLGLTDLFCIANRIAASHLPQSEPPLRVTHWQQSMADAIPVRIFDSGYSADSVLMALILPPTLGEPAGADSTLSLTAWLREQHSNGDAAILKVQHWLQATQAKEIALPALAARAGLEERTLLRRFQKATGMTTTEYYQRLRVGRARELLQFGNASIERVAWEVGYSDPGAFRKVFMRIVGLSPSDYRRRFTVEQKPAS